MSMYSYNPSGYGSYGSYGSRYYSGYGSSYGSRYGSRYGSSYGSCYYRNRYNFGSNSYTSYGDNTYYYGRSRRRAPYSERERERNRSLNRNRRRNRRRSPSPPKPETPPPPPKPVIPEEELVKELHVKDVNLHIDKNTENHRTNDYDCTKKRKVNGTVQEAELVVRRGQCIKITITFDRPYSQQKNDLKLSFSTGDNPRPSKRTNNVFVIDETGKKKFKPHEWGAHLLDETGNDVTVSVYIPSNCIIGEWDFNVITISDGKDKEGKPKRITKCYETGEDIYILFNPWCKDDEVYMEDQSALDEYVLNDTGAVWRGNAYQYSPKPWHFGQHDEQILDAAFHLLRSGFNSRLKLMSDAVKVSRMISKMVSSQDDKGILAGNWSGNYDDGTSPSKWVGSVKIIRQWLKSGPVKYGQCWVFSCVTTTICRAVGIPCRTVTNFASAHDTDGSNGIEKYFKKENGVDQPYNYPGSSDSVWNFHVWNEVWMSRDDLFDFTDPDWQVIDATPQETSEGVYQCGPCPIKAIRKGMCKTSYDCGFIFAEVNADEIHWRVLDDGSLKRLELHKKKIGKAISTKKPTGEALREWTDDRLDLTLQYKPPEGSAEERETVRNAHKTAFNRLPVGYEEPDKDKKGVKFQLTHDDNCMIGGRMVIGVKAKNESNVERTIRYIGILVSPTSYTGNRLAIMHQKLFRGCKLKPGEEQTFETALDPEDYLDKLVEQASVSILAIGKVSRVGSEYPVQKMKKEHQVRFRRPDITVECPKECHVGDNVKFVISFDNPIDKVLTCCSVSMEGGGFDEIDDIPEIDVPAKGAYRREFTLPAARAKKNCGLIFSFECKEIPDISGTKSIKVLP